MEKTHLEYSVSDREIRIKHYHYGTVRSILDGDVKQLLQTRIFFSTDFHGSDQCFLKFINAGKFYKASVIICGGDITGKMIVPLISIPENGYEAEFVGRRQIARGENEAAQLEKSISQVGYYPFRTTKEGFSELNEDRARLDELFSELMVQRVRNWIRIAEDKLRDSEIKCIINAGNDDRMEIDDVLESSKVLIHPEGKIVKVDEKHEMISTGYTNMTPWNCPRDISEEELATRIQDMTSKVSDMQNCIFNSHCPPFDSAIDAAPKLDKDLKPVVSGGGEIIMVPVGSTAVRAAIEKYQPLLGLHGHMHESKGSAKVGRTLCVNPGSEYAEGILKGALITIEDGKIKTFQFTSG